MLNPLVGHATRADDLRSQEDSSTLASRVGHQLRERIIMGELAPGEPLRFDGLRKHYGISVTPLREALSILMSEGLVIQAGQRGFRVAPMSLEEFEEISELRIELEGEALLRSVRSGDEGWEIRVLAAQHRLSKASTKVLESSQGIDEAWELRHRELHLELLSSCQSPWRLKFCRQLHDQFDRYRRLAGVNPRVSQAIIRTEEDEIVRAALDRDPELARDLLVNHIDRSVQEIASALTRESLL